MVILDVSIVNVALPSIQEDLHFKQDDLQWVLSAYALTFGGFLLLGGRVADLLGRRARLHGRRRALHPRLARVRPLGLRGHADRRPRRPGPRRCDPLSRRRSRSSRPRSTRDRSGTRRSGSGARWAAAVPRSASCSAGILTKALGWEWIFFVNVPIGAFVLATTRSIVKESRAGAATRHFDALGAVSSRAHSHCSSSPSPRRTASAGARPRRSGS